MKYIIIGLFLSISFNIIMVLLLFMSVFQVKVLYEVIESKNTTIKSQECIIDAGTELRAALFDIALWNEKKIIRTVPKNNFKKKYTAKKDSAVLGVGGEN